MTTSITWHKYPDEKPTVGTYLVTCKDFDGVSDLCFGEFKYGTWVHCPYLDDQVIAWAEMPKPYGEE